MLRWAGNYRHTSDLKDIRNALKILKKRQESENVSEGVGS